MKYRNILALSLLIAFVCGCQCRSDYSYSGKAIVIANSVASIHGGEYRTSVEYLYGCKSKRAFTSANTYVKGDTVEIYDGREITGSY